MSDRPYLSIGEVLGLLLEEFPDVTISKIRFLESQGLIDPERTASGYRKFYDNDVDLLRVILREQRENFLPLRVIRDRLESGAIEDPTGPTTPPRGIRNVPALDVAEPDDDHHFASGSPSDTPEDDTERDDKPEERPDERPRSDNDNEARPGAVTSDHKRDSFPARDLCHLAGLTPAQLAELESYGLAVGQGHGRGHALHRGRSGHRRGRRRVHAARCRGSASAGVAPSGRA